MKKDMIRTTPSCPNYCKDKNPMIELINFPSGKRLCETTQFTTICFLTKGALKAEVYPSHVFELEAGTMFLLPAGKPYTVEFTQNSYLLVFRIQFTAHFCENYNLKSFVVHKPHKVLSSTDFKTLDIRGRLSQYIDLQDGILSDGLRCKLFMEIKTKELFWLLKAYYSPEELAAFFAPLLIEDFDFYNKVMTNWMIVSNVKQLADICHYSESGFIKHFKKTFGESPYHWVKSKRGEQIATDIKMNNLSDKEISDKYDFNAMSYFYTFCKREYGLTPTMIRQENERNELHKNGNNLNVDGQI